MKTTKNFRQHLRRVRQGVRHGPKTGRPLHGLMLEALEDRALLSLSLSGVPTWIEQGPGPMLGSNFAQAPDGDVAGAVEAIAAHPTDPDTIYVGAVNGGIWKTTNATSDSPNWEPVTDHLPSLAIGALALSPLDPSHNTLFAGIGRSSRLGAGTRGSANLDVGSLTGVLRTTDGGQTWTQHGQATFADLSIRAILPTRLTAVVGNHQLVFAAAIGEYIGRDEQFGVGVGGLFLSQDDGETWVQISGSNGLPYGDVSYIAGDPGNPLRYYAGVVSAVDGGGPVVGGNGPGVYATTDGGQIWTSVTNNLAVAAAWGADGIDNDGDANTDTNGNGVIGPGDLNVDEASESQDIINSLDRIEFSVTGDPHASPNPVYAALFTHAGSRLQGIFRSTDGGATWTTMSLPGGDVPGPGQDPTQVGVYRRGGHLHHFAILADRSDPDVIFVSFRTDPNSGLSGYVLLGDVNPPAGSPQFTSVVRNGAHDTFPHPDSRDLVLDADGNLLEADDGGIYRLLDPYDDMDDRRWESVNGDLRAAEVHSVAYDSEFNRLVAGLQDNGTLLQPRLGDNSWRTIHGGDGGGVQTVTGVYPIVGDYSVIYHSSQNLGGFTRLTSFELFGDLVSSSDPIDLIVEETGGMTLEELDSPQFYQPYLLNTVDPNRMIFGTQFLYESFDRGDALTQLGGPPTGIDNDGDGTVDQYVPNVLGGKVGRVTAMAYGGFLGDQPFADVLYVGAAGNLLFRSDSDADEFPALLPAYSAAAAGADAIDIVLDPQDYRIAHVLDDRGRIWKTTDAGASFDEVTGNLDDYTSELRTIELYDPTAAAGDDILLVGGVGGVYRRLDSGAGTGPIWTEFGRGLPNAIATDLHYNQADDILLVATVGRGVWTIAEASNELSVPAALIISGDSDFVNQPDDIELTLDRSNPLLLRASLNNEELSGLPLPVASLEQIIVTSRGGNDSLTIDFAGGVPIPLLGVHYNGGRDTDSVLVVGTSNNDMAILTTDQIVFNDAPIAVASAEQFTVQTRAGHDTVSVERIPDGTSITVHAGAGDDRIHISRDAQRLLNVLGNLTIDAGPDDDWMTLNDQTNDAIFLTNSYTVTDAIAGLGLGQVRYDDTLERLTLNAGIGDSFINVESTVADTFINSGDGDDRIHISRDAQSLFNIRGPVTVDAGLGSDHLLVNDQSNAASLLFNIYTLTEDIVGLGTGQIGYNESVERLTLNTGVGPSFINVESTIAETTINSSDGDDRVNITPSSQSFADIRGPVEVHAGPGNDRIVINDQSNASAVDNVYIITADAVDLGTAHVGYDDETEFLVLNAGVGDSVINVESISADTTIHAGAGNDRVNVSPMADVQIPLRIDAEGGTNDTLDYSAYTTGVTVNLLLGFATGVSGGVANFENVVGGAAGDILVGDAQGNALWGGAGRDLLIGGSGADALAGNSGDDLLIGGTTRYDRDQNALDIIMAEWSRTGLGYPARIVALRDTGVGLGGSIVLNPSTVFSDGEANSLLGGSELDWFFANRIDVHDWDESLGEELLAVSTPQSGTVVEEVRLFYNNSSFDGNNTAGDANDLNAVDTSKVPATIGQPVTFQSISGNAKGINGLTYLLNGAPGGGANITVADFVVRTGTTNNINGWAARPAPTVTILGNGRILLTFPDNAIQDTFVAVQLQANANTGLAQPHTAVFGNVRGDTGAAFLGQGQFFGRDAADFQAMAQPAVLFQPATVTSATDVNRDGTTNAFDFQGIAIAGVGSNVLSVITPAFAAVPAPGFAAAAMDEAVADPDAAGDDDLPAGGFSPAGAAGDGRVGSSGASDADDRDLAFSTFISDSNQSEIDLIGALATGRWSA